MDHTNANGAVSAEFQQNCGDGKGERITSGAGGFKRITIARKCFDGKGDLNLPLAGRLLA